MVSCLPLLWKDACEIRGRVPYTKANGATGFRDAVIVSGEPCKLSFRNSDNSNAISEAGYHAAPVFQQVKLFLRPDLEIPEGCSVTVTTHKNQKTLHYKSSGTPMLFTDHQEINMEVDKEWA